MDATCLGRIRALVAGLVGACLLFACGGPDGPGGPGLNVGVTLDQPRSQATTVPLGGGTLEATAADGTHYTLTIPPDALLEPTSITMTPVMGLSGSPVTGSATLGVHLAPDGLRLHQPATLLIEPLGGPAVEAMSFAYAGSGAGFHGYPLGLSIDELRFDLMHFSGYVVVLGPAIEVSTPYEDYQPTDWEGEYEHALQELVNAQRDAHLRGEEGDPQFAEKLEALLGGYFDNAIAPLLQSIASDCGAVKAHADKVIAWSRQTQLFGLGESFEGENAEIWESIVSGLKDCWNDVVKPCMDPDNQAQVNEAADIARRLALMGEDPADHDPYDPALRCDTTWSGTVTYVVQGSQQYSSDLPDVVETGQKTLDYRAEFVVTSVDFWVPGGSAHLRTHASASGTLADDYYHRKENYATCISSGQVILRYEFEDSYKYELVGEAEETNVRLSLIMEDDGTYLIQARTPQFYATGEKTSYHYYIDNCRPESMTETEATEPMQWSLGGYSLEAPGETDPEAPGTLGGQYVVETRSEDVMSTVTITWHLTLNEQE